jgi:PhnB protein
MGSDTPAGMPYDDSSGGITVSVSGDDATELRGYWDGLADGGEITLPLEQAPWGDAFGQLNDRYGTPWMFNIAGAAQG